MSLNNAVFSASVGSRLQMAIAASQRRSLRQAAEALNIRQSTLSRRLRALWYQLGAVLFEAEWRHPSP